VPVFNLKGQRSRSQDIENRTELVLLAYGWQCRQIKHGRCWLQTMLMPFLDVIYCWCLSRWAAWQLDWWPHILSPPTCFFVCFLLWKRCTIYKILSYKIIFVMLAWKPCVSGLTYNVELNSLFVQLGIVMFGTLDSWSSGSRVWLLTVLLSSNNSRQVVHTHVPLSPGSIIWYWPKSCDALQLRR